MGKNPSSLLLIIVIMAFLTGCGSPSDETAPSVGSSSQITETDQDNSTPTNPTQGESLPNNVVDGKPEDDTVYTDNPDISELE